MFCLAVVDLAAMRNAMARLGGNPEKINPLVPADLVVDHSVQVDYARDPDALAKNLNKEMERNAERFQFLKWSVGDATDAARSWARAAGHHFLLLCSPF